MSINRADNPKRQFNPLPKIGSYLGNIGKEVKQYGRAWSASVGANYDAKTYPPDQRPALNAKADSLRAKSDSAFGQLAGAVLQGRRYNDKTGKQING